MAAIQNKEIQKPQYSFFLTAFGYFPEASNQPIYDISHHSSRGYSVETDILDLDELYDNVDIVTSMSSATADLSHTSSSSAKQYEAASAFLPSATKEALDELSKFVLKELSPVEASEHFNRIALGDFPWERLDLFLTLGSKSGALDEVELAYWKKLYKAKEKHF